MGRRRSRLGMRSAPSPEQVLPLIQPRLREGSTAVLDVLGRADELGSGWGGRFLQERGLARRHMLELLLRGSAKGHGLAQQLLRIVDEDEEERPWRSRC